MRKRVRGEDGVEVHVISWVYHFSKVTLRKLDTECATERVRETERHETEKERDRKKDMRQSERERNRKT